MSGIVPMPDLAERLARTRVLVVGDLMLDCYYWGDVRRVSPEAPVPIVKVNSKTFRLGGAGNVAANLAGLGCRVTVAALVGADAAAGQVRALMSDYGIDDHCIIESSRPTITKTRIMADRQQVVRLDEEEDSPIGEWVTDSIRQSVEHVLDSTQAVILSDYGKGLFKSFDFIQTIIQSCRRAGVPVFIDPKDRTWERYSGATCITPNTAELELVIDERITDSFELDPVARDLCRRLSLDWLLVTRGPKGMSLFGHEGASINIPARTREVFDVSGAGDTVIATLAACVAAGMTFDKAAAVANTAAGVVVAKLATQRIRWSDLERALEDGRHRRPASTLWKVADVEEASVRIARWRQMEQQVVFTNGCFDLLHPGHVSLLHQARQLGDRLIVGLNTDESIQRLKGKQRPILPGPDRAAILSALEDVDMVVFFGEDTPLNLIDALKPDVLVKGADYRIEDVVGRETVEAYGGRVRLVEILEGHSTTGIARKLSADPNHSAADE